MAATEVIGMEAAIAAWIARGFTREQAIHQVHLEQQRFRPANNLQPSNFNNRMSSYDEDEVASMVARGFSREQAIQLTHRRVNTQSYDTNDPRVRFFVFPFLIDSLFSRSLQVQI